MSDSSYDKRAGVVRRAVDGLVVATVTLYLILGGVFTFFYIQAQDQRHDLAVVARATHHVQCAQKAVLQRTIRSSQQFLADVRAGHRPRIPGISDADIVRSIQNTQNTLSAYRDLPCEGV